LYPDLRLERSAIYILQQKNSKHRCLMLIYKILILKIATISFYLMVERKINNKTYTYVHKNDEKYIITIIILLQIFHLILTYL
jgi:hypothetical protein